MKKDTSAEITIRVDEVEMDELVNLVAKRAFEEKTDIDELHWWTCLWYKLSTVLVDNQKEPSRPVEVKVTPS